jgi:hypothetical protein
MRSQDEISTEEKKGDQTRFITLNWFSVPGELHPQFWIFPGLQLDCCCCPYSSLKLSLGQNKFWHFF